MNKETQAVEGVSDGWGNQIEAGDKIVYATRRGSSTNLNKMLVQELDGQVVVGYLLDDPTRRRRRVQNLGTTHVVEKGETDGS